jgi:hypothetical protein
MLQEAPGESVEPQVWVCKKSPGSAPDTLIAPIFRVDWPALLRIITEGFEIDPTVVGAKVM